MIALTLNKHFQALAGGIPLSLLERLAAFGPSAAAEDRAATASTTSLRIGSASGQAFAPAAALNGMTLEAKPGPRTLGLPTFVVAALPVDWITIRRGANGPAIALVHAGAPTVGTGPSGSREYKFGAGSLWIVAKELANQAPLDGLAGMAIASATLIVPPPFTSGSSTEIVVGPFATAELSIAPAAAAPAAPGFSNQGSSASLTLPSSMRLSLAPSGAHVIALADATLHIAGQDFHFSGGWSATSFDATTSDLALTYHDVAPHQLVIPPGGSGGVNLAGSAAVTSGAWRLPVAVANPTQLGPLASGGALALGLNKGLSASWGTVAAPVKLGTATLMAVNGGITLVTTSQARRFTDTYALWDAERPGGSPPRATDFTFVAPRGAVILLVASTTTEVVLVSGCHLEAHLDRPLTVQGKPVGLDSLELTYAVERTASSELLFAFGQQGPAALGFPAPQAEVLALLNALVYTAGMSGLLAVVRLSGGRGRAGVVIMAGGASRLLPTLPDPYASSIARPLQLPLNSQLIAFVLWTDPADSTLAFAFDFPVDDIVEGLSGVLLDVSSNSDQLGLGLSGRQAGRGLQLSGQTLELPGAAISIVALPQISWEAVISDSAIDPTTNLPVPAPRAWFPPISPNDGPLLEVSVPTQTLRPLDVRPAVADCIARYAAGANLAASFTLPFGITADVVASNASGAATQPRPTLAELSSTFGPSSSPKSAGLQLRLAGVTDAQFPQAALPGSADASSSYAQGMLAADIANFWQQEFASSPSTNLVPVTSIDFSGYGASLFSYWTNPTQATAIDQVRFDVLVGRTAFELVQAQSFILHPLIPVVNTTIFQRDAAGYVARHNTGWQAKGPGLFAYPGATVVEKGALLSVQNVHNIRETGLPDVTVKEPAGTFVYRPVTFDADLAILTDPAQHGLAIAGDPPGGIIPTRGMSGYLAMTVGFSPTLAHAIALSDMVVSVNAAPVAGPISIDAAVASTGIGFSLTSVDIRATRADVLPRTLAVAVRGTPHLPRDGAWSISRRTPTDQSPTPIDPLTPVPLVRFHTQPATWHMAEPDDVVKLDAPKTVYGLVQATGTQKLLYEHPTVVAGSATPLQPQAKPQMADVGALLGISGLLPDLGSLLDLGPFAGFAPSGDGLAMQTIQKEIAIPQRTLIALGPVQVTLTSYLPPGNNPPPTSHITIKLDAAAPAGSRWSITAQGLAFGLVVDGFGDPANPLITVHGDALAQDGSAPTLKNLSVDYGSALSLVQQILSGIQTLSQFLPGGGDAPFSIDFTGTALKVRESFGLPQLPLGLGYLQDIALDLGFDLDLASQSLHFFVGVGTDQDPFSWLVSPLSGNGILQLGATDRLGVKLQAGVGAGLGIDLAIASGSASVVLAAQIDTTQNPLVLMVLLTGNASVDVLDGLASVSLTLTAGLGIGVKTPPSIDPVTDPVDFVKQTTVTLAAEVAVAIHLSVCWVCHVDWSGSWPFSETVSGQMLTSLI